MSKSALRFSKASGTERAKIEKLIRRGWRPGFLVPITQSVEQSPQQPQFKKRNKILRKDMETAFQHGARAMTRTEAVEVLKSLGFGKSAAYEALSPNGRFSAWLHFAPDGIITWTDR
jgi:hypothetical protein